MGNIHPKLYCYDYYHYYYAIYVDWLATYMLNKKYTTMCTHVTVCNPFIPVVLYLALAHSTVTRPDTQIQMALVASAIFGFWVVFISMVSSLPDGDSCTTFNNICKQRPFFLLIYQLYEHYVYIKGFAVQMMSSNWFILISCS